MTAASLVGGYWNAGAQISDCKVYRWRLWRVWDYGLPMLMWVMLNPSTADGESDDQTILTIVAIAKAQGYGGIVVVNAYAFRATSPKVLEAAGYPVGELNDEMIRESVALVEPAGGRIVLAWGNNIVRRRALEVATLLKRCATRPLLHISMTKQREPRHPLYCKHDVALLEWVSPE